MSKEKELEPKLRFREFEDCDVWNSYKLGNITQILTGGTPSTKVEDYWYPKDIPWMASGEINKKRLFKTDNLISYNGFENSSATWIKEKSVLIALAGQGKTRGTVAINEIPLTTNQSIAAILPFKNKLYPEFLYQNLDNRYEELRLVSSGDGTRGGLNKDIISELQVKAPNILEQKMIGNFFKKIDKMIQLQQSKLNKVKNIKSAYLTEMFPKEGEKYPKKRFEGFTEPWTKYKLREFGKSTGGTSIESEFTEKGEYKVISIGSYSKSSEYIDQGLRTVKTKKTEKRILNKNDLTMILNDKTTSGDIIGRVLLIDDDNTYVYNQRTERIEVNKENFIPEFLYQYLNSNNARSKIIEASQGNTQIYVNWSTISELKYLIPNSLKEQEKIGQFFKNLDHQISIEEDKLAKLEKLKQAYLNDMFV